MRKQVLGLIIPLLALALVATAADVTVKATASLERLEVSRDRDGLRVEFKATGPLAPKVMTSSPRRASSWIFPTP